jgi:predicted dehydrogenase
MKSRRTFLKKAGLASAGVYMAGPLMGMSAASYNRIVGANDRVNVGIVGFSDRAKYTLIPCFTHHNKELNFDIIGVSDIWSVRREEGAEYLKEKMGHSMRTYLNNEVLYADKDIDAVIISTADFQHAVHAMEAAMNKKDAYVEKPFAETMDDNRKAKAAVDKSGIILQIGSQRRSGSNYHAANDYIRSGKFGDIVMAEMTWNVNQPGRWRRPELVAKIKRDEVDWNRYLTNRPYHEWDPRLYLEYRLFWPFSSGIPGQWMAHQIDTVHWFTGLNHPRTVVANGGIYLWKDGRKNFDTMTAVMEYGPEDDPTSGFQVLYSSRFTNSAGGIKEIYYSNGGELNLAINKVTPNGGLNAMFAGAMGMKENLLDEFTLKSTESVVASANTGGDPLSSAHMRNWMECIKTRKQTNAPVEAGYNHSIACIMVNAAIRTKETITFDPKNQEVLAGGKVFKY